MSVYMFVYLFVCQSSLQLFRFWQLLPCADKPIVNNDNVHKRKKMQVDLIGFEEFNAISLTERNGRVELAKEGGG